MSKCSCQRSQNTLAKQLFLTITLNVSYLEQLSKQEKTEQEDNRQKTKDAVKEKEKCMKENLSLLEEIKDLKTARKSYMNEMLAIKQDAAKIKEQFKDYKKKD